MSKPPPSKRSPQSTAAREARKRRSDAGSIALQERDIAMGRFIAQQRAVRYDHLTLTMGSRDIAARWLVRMRQLGVLETREVMGHHWAWVTRRGGSILGLPYQRYDMPGETHLHHLHAITTVRLCYHHFYPLSSWRSERDLRSQGAQGGVVGVPHHFADGLLLDESNTPACAIEVERKPKTVGETLAIMRALLDTNKYVDYWCLPAAMPTVKQAKNYLLITHPHPLAENALNIYDYRSPEETVTGFLARKVVIPIKLTHYAGAVSELGA